MTARMMITWLREDVAEMKAQALKMKAGTMMEQGLGNALPLNIEKVIDILDEMEADLKKNPHGK